jgi:hypothetical protein
VDPFTSSDLVRTKPGLSASLKITEKMDFSDGALSFAASKNQEG